MLRSSPHGGLPHLGHASGGELRAGELLPQLRALARERVRRVCEVLQRLAP